MRAPSKSPVTFQQKILPKLSCFWQAVSLRTSSPICCLYCDYKTLADDLLFLKQFHEICGFAAYSCIIADFQKKGWHPENGCFMDRNGWLVPRTFDMILIPLIGLRSLQRMVLLIYIPG
jgi:hypothetical protein